MTYNWYKITILILLSAALEICALNPKELDEAIAEFTTSDEDDVDIERKTEECKQLVQNAVKHFEKVPLASACNDFIHNEIWRKGELYVFVYTADGICLAYGDDYDRIWKSIKDAKGIGGGSLMKELLEAGRGDGLVRYAWNNSSKFSYVRTVKKNGIDYLLGCGFYPESDEYATKQVVKTAATYFLEHGKEATFSLINNPKGPFVTGDIYMFVYDFDGVNVAHGNNPALIGQNLIDLVDSQGKPLIKELINIAKTAGKGWLDYIWRNELKRSYVRKVVDPKTKIPYLFSAGYHPKINLPVVQSYVKDAISYLKTNGAKSSFAEFSSLVGKFARGGLGIFVFDYNGKNLANGKAPANVGQNLLKTQGTLGRFYVRDIIETAKKNGSALIPYYSDNANALAYAERVETPDGKFIIGAEFFPASKRTTTRALVSRAVEYFNGHTPAQSFNEFSMREGSFIRGDVHIFAYDTAAVRLVNGTRKSQIWRNMSGVKDQVGKAVVNDIISVALKGGGWVDYEVRNATRRVYAQKVRKKLPSGRMKEYIIGSGYFPFKR